MSALPRLYVVSDRAATGGRGLVDALDELLAALPPRAAMVQLREKDLPAHELLALARRALAVCRRRRCPLLVNDRLDVALAAGADGVHLPDAGMDVATARAVADDPGFLVGVSTHSAADAIARAGAGADLVVLGPVWATPSKRAFGPPLGTGAIAAARDAAAPVYAIGGVDTAARAREARAAGAHGVAGIRGFLAAADRGAAARAIYEACVSTAR